MTAAAAPTVGAPPGALVTSLRRMHPSYFAMAMATGIVSIAADLQGLWLVAYGLFWLNVAAYAVLWALLAVRVTRFPDAVWADVTDHARGVGFFTIIAATCVLGTQFLLLADSPPVALGLWCLGIVLWLVLIYGIFTILTVRSRKPPLERGINGGWLVAVVAAQSVAVLGAQLAPSLGRAEQAALFFCLVVWLGGGMLYVWMISLIFYRYTFRPMRPDDLAPPYWINMGAVAISTLAGTFLIHRAPHGPLLAELLPFLKGLTLLFWATATWWIPMLLTLGFWRHVWQRYPLRYDPLFWGAVFPLGMYAACTHRLAEVMDLPFLFGLPWVFTWIALLAWALTFVGLVIGWVKLFRSAGGRSAP